MQSLYPAGPASVPAQLTAPSASYRRHAWLAMGGLLAFVLAYLGLLGWFSWTAWRLVGGVFSGAAGDDVLLRLLAGGCAAFLALFMAKALVFIKRGEVSGDIELDPRGQPELFAFLHRLADEAGAPRPHRVYLSARVNAAVFYDLSLLNLLLPSRKNLEIGLGLANVLTLGELKAVLAHEFGHFAQRTMAVGRWVYIAQQIAAHIIAKRDALDTFLRGLSSIDFRVAWIGWLLSLVVWSIRSLVELMFRVVVLAQRALSREMEYQADLVAVSLTGSDALVHALHRLGAADEAWGRAVDFVASERAQGRAVRDLFAVQSRIIERMRAVLADPLYGEPPVLPGQGQEAHRVFRAELAQPPRMWATHPANADREDNAKRTYIPAGIDPRPALVLFREAEALKAEATRRLFTGETPPEVPIEESLAKVDSDFNQPSLDRRYRGTYLGRAPFRAGRSVAELYSRIDPPADVQAGIAALYSAEHGDRLDRMRELEQERATLQALQAGQLTTTGGVVRWRGIEVPKRRLPAVITDLDRELAPLRESIVEHDRLCRSLHQEAARRIGGGWEIYLRSLVGLAHYAEHGEAELRDLQGLLANTVDVVTADRRVSANELKRLLAVANQLQRALAEVHAQAGLVLLDERVRSRLGATWKEALGEFGLPPATEANINEWMRVVDGWTQATISSLSALRRATLDTLLVAEDEVAAAQAAGQSPAAPEPSQAPAGYAVLPPGHERKRQTRLGWFDRFQSADGTLASLARLAVAGSIVGAVLLAGASIGKTTLSIYNGLAIPVQVAVAGSATEVPPLGSTSLAIPGGGSQTVRTHAVGGGLIEEFEAETGDAPEYAYNVAGAAALVRWTATYGSSGPVPEEKLGAPRWLPANADHVFSEPPESINTKGGQGTRTVLSAFADAVPSNLLELVPGESQKSDVIAAHVRWDDSNSRHYLEWLYSAGTLPGVADLLAARLGDNPHDVPVLRFQQDSSQGHAHDEVCARHRALAAASPDSADLHYLGLRCLPEGPAQEEAFISALRRWPDNGWLALAAGHAQAERQQWQEALQNLQAAAARIPPMADTLAVEIARLRRILGEDLAGLARSQEMRSGYLANIVALESGEGMQGSPMGAYAAIAAGRLQGGVEQAQANPEVAGRILRQAAASDGASADLVRRALALPSAVGVDDTTVWSALALAAREQADASAYVERIRASDDEDAIALLRYFDALRAGADVAGAEAALGAVSARARGLAYSMAVILRQERCPAQWREGAKRMLFAVERPYFR